jgi:beta-lactamase class A
MPTTGTHSDGVPIVSYCVRRAAGEVLAARHADERFYAASTVKVAVLAAAARALEAGTITLEMERPSTDTFASQVPGAPDFRIIPDDRDEGLPPHGTPMPLADVIERMIVVSSNEATNMVSEVVGLDAVRQVLADAGAAASSYGCMYSDFAASTQGARRDTTAGDLAALMSAVVTGTLAGPQWTAWMTAMLSRQHDRLLTAAVADGVPFGSKSGEVDGIRHDFAFIGEPGPGALVVAVCTRGYDIPAAEEAIRALGQLAVELRSGRPTAGKADRRPPSSGNGSEAAQNGV